MNYQLAFGENILRYAFHYEKTVQYMSPYIQEAKGDEYDIQSSFEYMDYLRPFYPESNEDAYVEYKSLINLTSLQLLDKRACLFHSVAFRYKGKAWLFTGRSGAGKTTQYRNWKRIFKDEVKMICGDMPCLEVDKEGKIIVYPSPWNGKERIKGDISAPLGGLILLEHGNYNQIEELSISDAVLPVFRQFAVDPVNEEDIRDLSYIADILLSNFPVWKLKNKADVEAVLLCKETLEKQI